MTSRSSGTRSRLSADQGLHVDRRHVLDVAGAPAVEVAVLLGQLERVERPVLPPGLHHVQMRQQQDGRAGAAAAEPGDQVLARRMRARDHDVLGGKSGGQEPARHRPRGQRGAAVVVRRVDADQLGEQGPGCRGRPRIVWAPEGARRGERARARTRGHGARRRRGTGNRSRKGDGSIYPGRLMQAPAQACPVGPYCLIVPRPQGPAALHSMQERVIMADRPAPPLESGTFTIGGDLPVHRLGFGAMRITGEGIWGPPGGSRRGHPGPPPVPRAGHRLHRHRRLLRARGQRAPDRRGAVSVSRGPGDRHQGRAPAAGSRPVARGRPARVSPRAGARQPRPAPAGADRPAAAPPDRPQGARSRTSSAP